METKDFSDSKSVNVDCSFCGNEIECPEEMIEKSKKHMCFECFITKKSSREEIENVHVDISIDKISDIIASEMADAMTEKIFPEIWTKRKNELKGLSKKDLAEEMLGAGTYLGIKSFIEIESIRKIKEDDTSDKKS